jgi:hypothetical protein
MIKNLAIALSAVACCTSIFAQSATGQTSEDASTRANRIAYESALKCFVAEGSVAGREKDAGDKVQQAAYEGRARQSFDIANALGGKLGYSGSHISQDFGLAQTEELPKLVSDPQHLKRVLATCEALGL